MVGISDTDKKFHPVVIGVQKSEDGMGSAAVLDLVTEMLTRSGAVHDCCWNDAAQALASGASQAQLIGNDCFAHITRLPFASGGGLCGSRGSMARYLLSVKDNKTKKRKYSLSDVCDIQSYAFGFKHLTTVHDWVTARAFFKAENPDLPDHFYEQYMPLYPRWGSACHEPGDVRSTQGLEKTWEHTKKKKKHHQKVNKNAKEIESIFESLSQ